MARFSRLDVYQRMLDEGLVPILVQAEPDTAAQALAAVAEGGATVCEFTNRSPQALESFRLAAGYASLHLPRMILGAGSIVDEPTAAISVRQVAEVLDLIRRLRDAGHAVVLISHRMPDVFAVADRVAVMRRGSKVADKLISKSSPEEVTGLITGAIDVA